MNEPAGAADYVLTNGAIYTVDGRRPWAEAIAIKGSEIVYVGSSDGASRLVGPATKVGDLAGRLVLPGMIDSHLHLMLGAVAASGVWLADIGDVDGVLAAISDYAAQHPDRDVVFGWGYGSDLFGPEGPTRELLDRAVSDRPAFIFRGDGHSGWTNTAALAAAGVDRDTPDPAAPAGVFGRDADGEPNGAINGGPANLWMVEHLPGAVTSESISGPVGALIETVVGLGFTSLFDAGAPIATDASFRHVIDLDEAGQLPLRYFASYYINASHQAAGAIERLKELDRTYRSSRFKIIALKITTDGVVENRKAALWEPYADGTGSGTLNFSPEEAVRLGVEAAAAGYDVYMHTLGDRAVSLGLDVAEAVRKAGHSDTHVTLSHCQLVREADFPRFKAADVFINSTATWWVFVGEAFEKAALGDRVDHEYPYRSMIDQGVPLALSSDYPADPVIDPFIQIEAAVTRQVVGSPASSKVKNPSSRISVAEAVEAYTINGARLVRQAERIGSLEVGKLADLIVVDQNIFEVDTKRIHETEVLLTMVDGEVPKDELFGWSA